jgi:hypothetical protein
MLSGFWGDVTDETFDATMPLLKQAAAAKLARENIIPSPLAVPAFQQSIVPQVAYAPNAQTSQSGGTFEDTALVAIIAFLLFVVIRR